MMETLHITRPCGLSQDEKTVYVEMPEGRKHFPVETLNHIVIWADATFTTKFLACCSKAGVRISFFDHYGWFRGSFEPEKNNLSGRVIQAQCAAIESDKRLRIAKKMVAGSLANAIRMLKKRFARNVANADALRNGLFRLDCFEIAIREAKTIPELMGVEGQWRAFYYGLWPAVHEDLDFGTRVRRPPNNKVNCLLSFLNGLVYATTKNQIKKTHMSDLLSFLHSTAPNGRSSLSLDLAEIYKPILADRLIFRIIGLGQHNNSWFDQQGGVCLLTEKGRKELVQMFTEEAETVSQGGSWRSHILADAYGLERELFDVEPWTPFLLKI